MQRRLVQRLELSQEQKQLIRLAQRLKFCEAEVRRYSKMLETANRKLASLNGDREKNPTRVMKLETDRDFSRLALDFFEEKRRAIVGEIRGEGDKEM